MDNAAKQRIMIAALAEFSSKPYAVASLNDILITSGVSKGSFYHHFKNKKDVYAQLLEQSVREKNEYISSRTQRQPTDLMGYIEAHFRAGIEFGRRNPQYKAFAEVYASDSTRPIEPSSIKGAAAMRAGGLADAIVVSLQNGDIDPVYGQGFIMRYLAMLFESFNDLFPDIDRSDPENLQQKIDVCMKLIKTGLIRKDSHHEE